MTVEDELRAILRDSGASPKQIGKETGIDYGAIYRFLGGRAQLRSGTFARLCSWACVRLVKGAGSPLTTETCIPGEELRKRLEAIREQAEAGLRVLSR